jgi:putative tryptophan/tyrosine transport system substrate-binding protein
MIARRIVAAGIAAAVVGPAVARAQLAPAARPADVPVVGVLSNGAPETYAPFVAAFRNGLRQIGFVEGRNVALEFRWARDQSARLPGFAAELVRLPAAVIVAGGGDQALQAAKSATATIPIVATIGGDPVENRLVASFNRPGGNLAGISVFAVELVPKRLQLARDLVPEAEVIAFLRNPSNPNSSIDTRKMEEAARTLRHKITFVGATSAEECDAAFASLSQQGIRTLIVESDPYFNGLADRFIALAEQHSIAVIYPRREFAVAGGLLSYGSSLSEAYRQIGIYTGRILLGDKPSELPILLPTKFEMVVNLRAAKALGLTVPPSILLAADEVIE